MHALYLLTALTAAQRLLELAYARRNTRRLLARGAVEHGRRHYPLLVLLHAGWLLAILIFVPPDAQLLWAPFLLFILCQLLRIWILASLGKFWTTRILTLPGIPLRRSGPYRFCRHPNYIVVVGEIALLPLSFGAWRIAAIFSFLNLALLAWRIAVEERAIADRRALSGPT